MNALQSVMAALDAATYLMRVCAQAVHLMINGWARS
jgi:hypothetical protein